MQPDASPIMTHLEVEVEVNLNATSTEVHRYGAMVRGFSQSE